MPGYPSIPCLKPQHPCPMRQLDYRSRAVPESQVRQRCWLYRWLKQDRHRFVTVVLEAEAGNTMCFFQGRTMSRGRFLRSRRVRRCGVILMMDLLVSYISSRLFNPLPVTKPRDFWYPFLHCFHFQLVYCICIFPNHFT